MRPTSIAQFFSHLFVFIFATFFATSLYAQSGKAGVLAGEVLESGSGAPMPGVTIRAALQSDSTFVRYTFTNGQGKYRFNDLLSGTYAVSYSELGYKAVNSTAQILGSEPTVLK